MGTCAVHDLGGPWSIEPNDREVSAVMMARKRNAGIGLVGTGLMAIACVSIAAESAPTEQTAPSKQEGESLAKLPKPLDEIAGNLLDLEKAGFFRVLDGKYGRTSELDQQAIVWTVRVVKPITCRHAMILLDRMGNVRFYRVTKRKDKDGKNIEHRKELLFRRLRYSPEIVARAAHHELLREGERFEVWVLLDDSDVWALRNGHANSVVFSDWKR